jgi:hypothetical protein
MPVDVTYRGEVYSWTGKCGHSIATGEFGREYESIDRPGVRIWRYESGRILED